MSNMIVDLLLDLFGLNDSPTKPARSARSAKPSKPAKPKKRRNDSIFGARDHEFELVGPICGPMRMAITGKNGLGKFGVKVKSVRAYAIMSNGRQGPESLIGTSTGIPDKEGEAYAVAQGLTFKVRGDRGVPNWTEYLLLDMVKQRHAHFRIRKGGVNPQNYEWVRNREGKIKPWAEQGCIAKGKK